MRNYERMIRLAQHLRERGHTVSVPVDISEQSFADHMQAKARFMREMFEVIRNCEQVLAVNDEQRVGYSGYIGPNTFLQLGLAFSLGKTLYCLSNWDPRLPYDEELRAMNIKKLDISLPH
jgi:hypothetical protein